MGILDKSFFSPLGVVLTNSCVGGAVLTFFSFLGSPHWGFSFFSLPCGGRGEITDGEVIFCFSIPLLIHIGIMLVDATFAVHTLFFFNFLSWFLESLLFSPSLPAASSPTRAGASLLAGGDSSDMFLLCYGCTHREEEHGECTRREKIPPLVVLVLVPY